MAKSQKPIAEDPWHLSGSDMKFSDEPTVLNEQWGLKHPKRDSHSLKNGG